MQGNSNFNTLAIHHGIEADPATGAVIPPINLSTTFRQSEIGVHKGYDYSRCNNPNRSQIEANVAGLERAQYGIAFSSGSAAIAALLNSAPLGTELIAMEGIYGGSWKIFDSLQSQGKIKVVHGDLNDLVWLESVINGNTKWIWIESPSNPLLNLVDIAAVTNIARARGVRVAVDNTFMTPYFQNPLALGADVAIHSGTKYLNGHSDVTIGFAVTNDPIVHGELRFQQDIFGAIPSPFDCYQCLRGIRTLGIRMEQHQINGQKVAEYLEKHPKVAKVFYPGLPSHPQHALAKKQQLGNSGIVTFILKGDEEALNQFAKSLKLISLGESLGGVESLCSISYRMSHGMVPEEIKVKWGIDPNVARVSCGIENYKDIIDDLEFAFNQI